MSALASAKDTFSELQIPYVSSQTLLDLILQIRMLAVNPTFIYE